MSEREEFERYAANKEGRSGLPHFILKGESGIYIDTSTQDAWESWQARAAQSPVVPDTAPKTIQNKHGTYELISENKGYIVYAMLDKEGA